MRVSGGVLQLWCQSRRAQVARMDAPDQPESGIVHRNPGGHGGARTRSSRKCAAGGYAHRQLVPCQRSLFRFRLRACGLGPRVHARWCCGCDGAVVLWLCASCLLVSVWRWCAKPVSPACLTHPHAWSRAVQNVSSAAGSSNVSTDLSRSGASPDKPNKSPQSRSEKTKQRNRGKEDNALT